MSDHRGGVSMILLPFTRLLDFTHLSPATFAIRYVRWYDREGVKFRDSGSEIERNIAKRQICHTLPERSAQRF